MNETAPMHRSASCTLGSHLRALRQRSADCTLAALCDLEAEIVLRHDAADRIRQEVLDRLSREAKVGFDLRDRARLALPAALAGGALQNMPLSQAAWGDTAQACRGDLSTGVDGLDLIQIIDDRGIRLFLRHVANPHDALILVCFSIRAIGELLPVAAKLLTSFPPMGTRVEYKA